MAASKLTFLELAAKVLEEARRPLSPSEIWEVAVSKGYDSSLHSKGRTPANTMYAAIFLDCRDRPESKFVKIGSRPARYYLKTLSNVEKPAELEKRAATTPPDLKKSGTFTEKQLHPFLAWFASYEFQAHVKTINHSASGKSEFGQWLHPDVIGVYVPEWQDNVRDLCNIIGNNGVKLFSFELKKKLTFANLRESFFQAVSNSSWANHGYLAAAEISGDEDFRSELQRLSVSFGIGIIELDVRDPGGSKVLAPAKERDVIDWDALNKLATLNSEVQALLKRIKFAIDNKEIDRAKFDQVYEVDQLINLIAQN
jgi:uncharacterized protein